MLPLFHPFFFAKPFVWFGVLPSRSPPPRWISDDAPLNGELKTILKQGRLIVLSPSFGTCLVKAMLLLALFFPPKSPPFDFLLPTPTDGNPWTRALFPPGEPSRPHAVICCHFSIPPVVRQDPLSLSSQSFIEKFPPKRSKCSPFYGPAYGFRGRLPPSFGSSQL